MGIAGTLSWRHRTLDFGGVTSTREMYHFIVFVVGKSRVSINPVEGDDHSSAEPYKCDVEGRRKCHGHRRDLHMENSGPRSPKRGGLRDVDHNLRRNCFEGELVCCSFNDEFADRGTEKNRDHAFYQSIPRCIVSRVKGTNHCE